MKKWKKLLSVSCIMFVFSGCSISKTKSSLDKENKIETTADKIVEASSASEKGKLEYKSENCVGVISSNTSFATDPSVSENLINISKSILKIKVIGKGDTVFPIGYPYPLTKYKVEVMEVIKGPQENKSLKEITVSGGNVSVYEYKKANPNKEDKFGLDKYTEIEAKEKFISYKEEYDFDFQNNHEYIVILNDNNTVINNGYGIFEADKNNTSVASTDAFLNVLTKKKLSKIK